MLPSRDLLFQHFFKFTAAAPFFFLFRVYQLRFRLIVDAFVVRKLVSKLLLDSDEILRVGKSGLLAKRMHAAH